MALASNLGFSFVSEHTPEDPAAAREHSLSKLSVETDAADVHLDLERVIKTRGFGAQGGGIESWCREEHQVEGILDDKAPLVGRFDARRLASPSSRRTPTDGPDRREATTSRRPSGRL